MIQQLRAAGTVKRGYLGIGIQPLSTDIAAGLGLPKDKGEIVASVEPSGARRRAPDIKQGDVILRINNSDVTYDNTLSYIVANTPVGTSVPIEIHPRWPEEDPDATSGAAPGRIDRPGARRPDPR